MARNEISRPPQPAILSETSSVKATAAIAWLLVFTALFLTASMYYVQAPRLHVLLELLPIVGNAIAGWDLSTLAERIDFTAVALLIGAGSFALGRLILRALGLSSGLDRATSVPLAGGLGLSAWSLVTLLAGVCGWLHQGLFAILLAAFLIAELVLRWRSARTRSTDPADAPTRGSNNRPRRLATLVATTCAPFVAVMILGAMLPPTDFDVKEYHLEGPKEYFLQGRITMLPHNVYTSFPFLTEMLSLSGMVLRDDWARGALAGKLVLMSFALVTAAGVFALARRLFGEWAAWLALLIWLTIPWTYRISIIAYAEGGLSCYLLLTALALQLVATSDQLHRTRPHLLLAGLMAGSAAACKYPAVLTVVIPAGLACLAIAFRRNTSPASPAKQTVIAAVLFSAGVLSAFGPWLLKNLIETGNPVYPLLYSVFGGESFDAQTNARWAAAHGPPKELLEHPAQILPDLWKNLRDVAVTSDWQSSLVFGLAPLSLLAWNRTRWLWAFAAWQFFTWLWATHRIDRFWVPMLPVLSVLGGIGASAVRDALERWRTTSGSPAPQLFSTLAAGAVALSLLSNLVVVLSPLAGNNAYFSSLDEARKQARPLSARVLDEARLPRGAKVLFVGEANVFDIEPPYLYNTVFDDSLLLGLILDDSGTLRSREELKAAFANHQITHVLVQWSEIVRYRLPGSYGFPDPIHPRLFEQLRHTGVLEPVHMQRLYWDSLGPAEQEYVEQWASELREQNTFRAVDLYRVLP